MITKDELQSTPIDQFKDDDDLIKKIEHSVDNWYDYFNENLETGYEDATFALGQQWTGYEAAEYYARQKVMLTTNVLYSFILNIVGEQRQNSPQMQLRARNNKTTQQQINNFEDILRDIAYSSKSDLAYQIGFMNALLQGFGAWRVAIDHETPESFNKQVFIQPILNPANAYFDPIAQDPTKCDGEFCGIYTKMNEEEFKKVYDIDYPESLFPPMMNSRSFNWRDKNGITILEHFHKVREKTKIYKLSNGDVVRAKDKDARIKELKKIREIYGNKLSAIYLNAIQNGHIVTPPPALDDIKIVDERTTELVTIKHYKAIKGHILEKGEFPSKYLPVIYVDGDSNYISGKQETKSFIKHAKDPQKFINMVMSDLAQMAKVGHKGEYLATEGQIGDYKELWKNPEKFNVAKLWKPDPSVPGDKPQYVPPAELPQSLVGQVNNLFQMIQISLGRYEANRGEQGNEQSGIAIANRAKQGNTSVFIYLDNLNKAIEQTGRVCLDVIPEILKDRDYIPSRQKDGKSKIIDLKDDDNKYLLNKQDIDVTVGVGASFEMQKADAFNQLVTILQVLNLPPNIIADLVVENTNLENTPQLLERIRNFVISPQIKAQEEGKPAPKQPPDPQLIIAQQEAQARLTEANARMMEAQARYGQVGQDAQVANVKAQAEMGKAQLDYSGKLVEHAAKIHGNQLNLHSKNLDYSHEATKRAQELEQLAASQQANPAGE